MLEMIERVGCLVKLDSSNLKNFYCKRIEES